MRLFRNRDEAAGELAEKLEFVRRHNPLILALPNLGVPIAAVIARKLDAPLDILLIAKLAPPGKPDRVVGAVDEHGRISLIQQAARWHHVTAQQLIKPARDVYAELQRRRARFRAVLPETDVRGRTVVIVNHGVETGATMLAAIASVRDRGAHRVLVAAPAGSEKATWQLHEAADTVVIPHAPSRFKGIEHFYQEYDDVTEREVEALLRRWAAERPEHHPGVRTLVSRVIADGERILYCELDLPPGMQRDSGPYPAVIFAHGRESDARSLRTVPISQRIAKSDCIGVRMDFTGHGRSDGSVEEAAPGRMLHDLETVLENVLILNEVDPRRIGVNGAGSGALVALELAARRPEIAAVVIRGPLGGGEIDATTRVKAPTLLIHGEHDDTLSQVSESLGRELASIHKLLVIPESNRWFNDPISLELMISASVDWLVDHLVNAPAPGEAPAPAAQAPR